MDGQFPLAVSVTIIKTYADDSDTALSYSILEALKCRDYSEYESPILESHHQQLKWPDM